jgi:hypothetical protein
MSSALSIAAITAILKNLLENVLVQQARTTGIGDVVVTTLSPDRVTIGADERPQLNLYLYRLTPNSGWRRANRVDEQKAQQEQSPALDLHYLLSAYGERDVQAEVLLGVAIQCLQQSSVISGERIRAALVALASTKSSHGHATLAALARASALVPLEEIKITPEFLSLEDLSKLWSSLQAHARLSVTYQVSVMLSTARDVETNQPTRAAR